MAPMGYLVEPLSGDLWSDILRVDILRLDILALIVQNN